LLDCSYYLGRYVRVNVPFVSCGIVDVRHRETHPFALFRGRAKFVA
jgi:hypothetical protein